MTIKIEKKITGYNVAEKAGESPVETRPKGWDGVDRRMAVPAHELKNRPDVLQGTTYKLKTPVSPHAIYITINDIIENHGEPDERRYPFEIFFNSKNMEHYQWIVALTRVMSAVFRKGGEISFLVEELKSVFDPAGGYWKKGGIYCPSLIADIADVLEQHLVAIGLMQGKNLDEHQKKLIAEKREQYAASQATDKPETDEGSYPSDARMCTSCHTKAVVRLDSCDTCLSCGASKCS